MNARKNPKRPVCPQVSTTSLGGFTPTYDSNGNLTNDNIHNYAWDADGHAITVDSGLSDAVSVTYDGLGRMVEQNRGGTYTQIAYSPTGQKLALMSGATLQKAMVSLSGQAQAVYNSSGLLYYAHADELGSVRLATTPAGAMYFDTAYAPFGETYASSGTLDPAYTGQMNDTAHRDDVAGGLYDFPAREYSIQGRWPSPDPARVLATCTKNPQTQNRYAYVTNNPLSFVDPLGTFACDPEDPACGSCDPSADPLCGIGFPIGGGGFSEGGHQEGWPGTIAWPVPPFPFPPIGGGDNPKDKSRREAWAKCDADWLKCLQKVNSIMDEQVKKHKEELRQCVKDCAITLIFGPEAFIVCEKVCAIVWDAEAAADVAARDLGYRLCDKSLKNCKDAVP